MYNISKTNFNEICQIILIYCNQFHDYSKELFLSSIYFGILKQLLQVINIFILLYNHLPNM